MKAIYFLVLTILTVFSQYAISQNEIWIKPNKGQWHDNVQYKIDIPGGQMYLENNGFTYNFNNQGAVADHSKHDGEELVFKGHAIKTTFVGANENFVFQALDQSSFYENYFLGNDSTKWVSNSYAYNEVDYIDLYDNIDLNLYESNSTLKYDVVVHPGGDPSNFKVRYEGQDKLRLDEGRLIIETVLGEIIEDKPFAYQIINGEKKEVSCNYILLGNEMTFEFIDDYNTNYDLVIDPTLIFSSFTGSTADNWGMTACPDNNENLIAAGIVFGDGYPISVGAYDSSFNNGQVDIGITKFTSDGLDIIFSTFIGGNGSETPHSMIVNNSDDIYIMGVTSSTDFPLGVSPYQNSNNGGASLSIDGISFTDGTDMYITRLSSNGNNIIGGTYIGGTSTDGISDPDSGGISNIAFNYGDQLRGEILVDDIGNVYVSSMTTSNDFPIQGGFATTMGGNQDAVVAKFDADLSNLLWSTYIGGNGMESGNSVQISSTGDIYVVGGTTSSNFPNTTGQLNPTFKGGSTDGYIIKFPAPTYSSPVATYLGTTEYDQAYFVRLDLDDLVYVYGQTKGNYPISSGKYNNPLSGQFIHKISSDLTTTEWSSVFGASSGDEEISPSAFGVSDCYEISIVGWGGSNNASYSNAINSSTIGFPITPDAFQSTTSGNNFYIAQFAPDMADLKYATFIGGLNGSMDHLDGGSSKIDKQGVVYHAVCGACGGNVNGFPTTPGAYSETNNSNNCNMAAFKFDLSSPSFIVSDNVTLVSNDVNGQTYQWLDCDNAYAPIAGATSATYTPPSGQGHFALEISNGICVDTSVCFDMANVGIVSAQNEFLIDIYPNPTNDVVNFINNFVNPLQVQFYDNSGKLIDAFWTSESLISYDLSKYQDGIYYFKIIYGDEIQVRKVIKM